MGKKKIVIYKNNSTITAHVPFFPILNIFIDKTVVVYLSNKKGKKKLFTLHFNAFDRPIIFYYSAEKDTMFIVYRFDIIDYIIKINNINIPHKKNYIDKILINNIIPYSNVFYEHANRKELNYLYDKISSISDNAFKELSIPNIDLGFYKSYFTKKGVLKIISNSNKLLE